MVLFSAVARKNTRLQGIDALRGLAVLLVICRHWNIAEFLTRLGWVGVDQFFVISGFLVSGLLFREHAQTGTLDLLRFFLRRGLKIYPMFFMLIALTACYFLFSGTAIHYRLFAHELLFLQNYLGGLYLHTWSLAVEEHFYLLLILCFALLHKKYIRFIPLLCLLMMLAPLVMRYLSCTGEFCNNHFFTHTRIDSLFTGVLLAYGCHYQRQRLQLAAPGRSLLLLTSLAVFALFGVVKPENYFTQTAGFTLLALASAGLLASVLAQNRNSWLQRSLAPVGFYSYGIYLLHIPVKLMLEKSGLAETSGPANTLYFLVFLACSVAGGIIFSELVEQPVLRWRDRVFPPRT
jgi:peptidoglycan/LPS O-acetylase OafA/YrhL